VGTNPLRDSSARLIAMMRGRGITTCAHPEKIHRDSLLMPQKTPAPVCRARHRQAKGGNKGVIMAVIVTKKNRESSISR